MILTLSSLYHSRNVHKYLPIMRGKKRVGVVLDRTKNGVLPYQINHIGGTNIYLLGRLCKLDQLVYNSQKDLEHCYFVNFIYFLPLIYWLIYQSLLNRLIKRHRFIIVRSLSKPLLQFRLFSEISPTCTLLTFLSCFIFLILWANLTFLSVHFDCIYIANDIIYVLHNLWRGYTLCYFKKLT